LEWRVTTNRTGHRLAVWCDVRHMLASGATVAELFTLVRPELEQAISTAAARDPGHAPMGAPVAIQLEFGEVDPEIWLVVHDPASCVEDMSCHMDKLQRILEKVISAERAGAAARRRKG
jgi:hypothetical protein